ncbi:uncharacterized protein LOC129759484, partial [Uranotaenia lowii]|uniref:uncharacterized protein LOC129759484 n=1 Tax=Uranotaenia lowii TaxID=190385 RepID=UPI00247A62B3
LDAPSVGSSGLTSQHPNGGGSNSSLNHPRFYTSLANRYRKSSSPARQWLNGAGNYATTGRTSRFPNAKPGTGHILGGNSNLLKNLRTTELRRSSAAGLNASSQRPPLPPKMETRCRSYEGLLDGNKKGTTEGQDRVDASASQSKSVENTPEPTKPTEESIKAKNRRSRSMDDLFDDDDHSPTNFLESTQSMENLVSSEEAPAQPETPVKHMGNICLNRRFVEPSNETDENKTSTRASDTASPDSCCEQPCENETITVDHTPRQSSSEPEANEKMSPAEDDSRSTTSSLNSYASASDGGSKKQNTNTSPFINKYMKKVKSLMKK